MATIAGETYAQGARRLANDLKVAMRLLAESAKATDDGWKHASTIIEQGVVREVRALNSARVFAGTNQSALKTIEELGARMKSKEAELMSDLQAYYRQLHGKNPPAAALTAEEMAASKKIPANAAPLEAYFSNRDNVRFRTRLHGLMRDEVFNFVDGKRSYYDIYKGVYAEAAAAGAWYYGTVTLSDVVGLLDAAVASKALTLK
jgi:hypothetical protein